MAEETTTDSATVNRTRETAPRWQAGVVAGLLGATAMAALVSAMNAETLTVAIPSLYGLAPPPNGVLGWAVHLSHGAVLGVGFVALGRFTFGGAGSFARSLGAGLAYGVVVWVVAAALLMPLWLRAVGSPAQPPFPNFAPPSLVWHLVYGGVLGAVSPAIGDRL